MTIYVFLWYCVMAKIWLFRQVMMYSTAPLPVKRFPLSNQISVVVSKLQTVTLWRCLTELLPLNTCPKANYTFSTRTKNSHTCILIWYCTCSWSWLKLNLSLRMVLVLITLAMVNCLKFSLQISTTIYLKCMLSMFVIEIA